MLSDSVTSYLYFHSQGYSLYRFRTFVALTYLVLSAYYVSLAACGCLLVSLAVWLTGWLCKPGWQAVLAWLFGCLCLPGYVSMLAWLFGWMSVLAWLFVWLSVLAWLFV